MYVKKCQSLVGGGADYLKKNAAALPSKTPLRAVVENDTRWSSKCDVTDRFIKIKDRIAQVDSLQNSLPLTKELNCSIDTAEHVFKTINITCKELQHYETIDDQNLSTTRDLMVQAKDTIEMLAKSDRLLKDYSCKF